MSKSLVNCIKVFAIIIACAVLSCCSSNNRKSSNNTIDGTYYWSDFQVSHTVVISGERWTGTTIMYGDRSYDFGSVKGNHLYDSSGYFEIARVSGNRIYWNNHTLVKDD